MSYQPTIRGRHLLHIRIEDQHIRESPFPVATKLPIQQLGTPIQSIDGVNGPSGVTINKKGELVVTECDGRSVAVLSPNGEKIRSFGTHGSGQGQFNHPCGVTMDGEGNLLIVDCYNNHIQKFTPNGQFLALVGDRPPQFMWHTRSLQFMWPISIVFNGM